MSMAPATGVVPGLLPGLPVLDTEALRRSGSSPAAIAAHYDLPADFFATWLGADLVYSCAWWDPDRPGQDLSAAQDAKIDYFASAARRPRQEPARRRAAGGALWCAGA